MVKAAGLRAGGMAVVRAVRVEEVAEKAARVVVEAARAAVVVRLASPWEREGAPMAAAMVEKGETGVPVEAREARAARAAAAWGAASAVVALVEAMEVATAAVGEAWLVMVEVAMVAAAVCSAPK